MKNEPKRFESDEKKHSGSLTSSITLKRTSKVGRKKAAAAAATTSNRTAWYANTKKRQCHSLTQLVTDYSLKVSSTGSSNGGYSATPLHGLDSTRYAARGARCRHQRTKQHRGSLQSLWSCPSGCYTVVPNVKKPPKNEFLSSHFARSFQTLQTRSL